MIAKIIQPKGGRGDFGRMVNYIGELDKKAAAEAAKELGQPTPEDQQFDMLGSYIADAAGAGHKVSKTRVTNCGTKDVRAAIQMVKATQAMNTRAEEKNMHLVVSFPAGEIPSYRVLKDVEDQLVKTLGLEDHQRISAVHINTDHLHLHVGINLIHPKTLKVRHPFQSERRLMAKCEELEIKHGLIRTNHGLSVAERSKAEVRGRAADMEIHSNVDSFIRWVRENARGALLEAKSAGQGRGWEAVHAAAAEYGLVLKPQGAGLVFVHADKPGLAVKASDIDRGLSMVALQNALGPFEPMKQALDRDHSPAQRYEPPTAAEAPEIREAGQDPGQDDPAVQMDLPGMEAPEPFDPAILGQRAMETLNQTKATWTKGDISREIKRQLLDLDAEDIKAMTDDVLKAIRTLPDLLTIPQKDAQDRYTLKPFVILEQSMLKTAAHLHQRLTHGIAKEAADVNIAAAEAAAREVDPNFTFTTEQRDGIHYLTSAGDLKLVLGLAGTGKSRMLDAARAVWEADGLTVQGAALSGIAAENLFNEAGIPSTTVAGLLLRLEAAERLQTFVQTREMDEAVRDDLVGYADWLIENGDDVAKREAETYRRELLDGPLSDAGIVWALDAAMRRLDRSGLTEKTVLVIDEAGMVGSRHMAAIVDHVEKSGAKLALVGDYGQLQSIDAGAPFRIFCDRFGYAALRDVRRQHTAWQRQATADLSEGKPANVAKAVMAYNSHGYVKAGVVFLEEPFIESIERRTGTTLTEADRDKVCTIARYAEARNAAGALWGLLDDTTISTEELEEFYGLFKEWQEERNAYASAIGADIEAYKPWLARFGISGEGLAADILFADGMLRKEAVEAAADHADALGILDIENTYKFEERLRADFRTGAKAALIEAWAQGDRSKTRIMLTHSRADAESLNHAARQIERAAGRIGDVDHTITVRDGTRQFAERDRILFLQPDKKLGVRNGTFGTINSLAAGVNGTVTISATLDNGKSVTFDTTAYNAVDHGWAATIHKTQGVTVDLTYLLGTSMIDRHLAYVGMSRHRSAVRTFLSAGDAAVANIFAKTAARARSQDSTLDYDIADMVQPHKPTEREHRYTGRPRGANSLWQQYQQENGDKIKAQAEAIAGIRKQFQAYHDKLNAWYKEQRGALDGNGLASYSPDKRDLKKSFTAQRNDLREQARATEREEIAAIRKRYAVPSWQTWLRDRAQEGDITALRSLRRKDTARQTFNENLAATISAEQAADVVLAARTATVNKRGEVSYRLPNGAFVQDLGKRIHASQPDEASAILALQLAAEKYGNQPLVVTGPDNFRQQLAEQAGRSKAPVRFADASMERIRVALLERDTTPAFVKPEQQGREAGSRTAGAGIFSLQYTEPTKPFSGRYTYLGEKDDEGRALLWRQHNTVFVQPITPEVRSLMGALEIGDEVEFEKGAVVSIERDEGLSR